MEDEFNKRMAQQQASLGLQFNEDMQDNSSQANLDTSMASTKAKEKRTMGTRKNPIDVGRVPNVIRNVSEMSYDENTNSMNYQ